MTALRYGDRTTHYLVEESVRLTSKILIHVHPDGVVEVETPAGANPALVKAAMQKRARWIFDNLDATREARTYALPREYVGGETHFYLGRRYRLSVKEARGNSPVKLLRGTIQVTLRVNDKAAVKQRLRQWYKERANDYFTRRLTKICADIEWLEEAPRMKLVPMEYRWGSCSPKGSININPALVRAPKHCIDYVLIHEICHLKEHNHSKHFYALLDKHLPNWNSTKAELDRLAELLLVD